MNELLSQGKLFLSLLALHGFIIKTTISLFHQWIADSLRAWIVPLYNLVGAQVLLPLGSSLYPAPAGSYPQEADCFPYLV